jgi:hypothetical protein
MAAGRTPTLPTVRQSHPALHPVDPVGPPGDPTVEMPALPGLRRQELAPWSPHRSTAAARAAAVTPPAGTPATDGRDEPRGRRRGAHRGMAWILIGGVGLYLVIIALGLAGVLYVGRLSPPGLDRLTRPSGTTPVTTDSEGTADPASPAPAEPTGGGAGTATSDTTTAPPPGSSTASDVDDGAEATGAPPGDSDPSDVPTEPSSPAPTESSTTTTTEPSSPDSQSPSASHPHGGPPGHAGKP